MLVAAIGHAFGPNSERGVFRSTDGGATWSKTLFKDEYTGAIDVTFDPSNPRIVYAALWQVRRQPWNFSSGGPGSGLYRSGRRRRLLDRTPRATGLPDGILGRIGVSVSAADQHRVYAMIEAKDSGLYRSDDGGTAWRRVRRKLAAFASAPGISQRSTPTRNPSTTVYALNTGMLKSADGGKSFKLVSATHGDHRSLWSTPPIAPA